MVYQGLKKTPPVEIEFVRVAKVYMLRSAGRTGKKSSRPFFGQNRIKMLIINALQPHRHQSKTKNRIGICIPSLDCIHRIPHSICHRTYVYKGIMHRI